MRLDWLKIPTLLLLFLSLCLVKAEATQASWSKLMIEAERGDDLTKFLAAIKIAEMGGERNPRLHIALHNAGYLCAWKNKHLEYAEDFLKRDIVLLEKISINFPDIVSDCYELANVYEWQGRYKEAEPLLLRAVAVRKKWEDLQSNDPFNAEIYASLYSLYYIQGNDAKAAEAKSQMLSSLASWHTDKARAECLFKIDNDLYKFATRCKHLDPVKKKHLLEMALPFAVESSRCCRRYGGEGLADGSSQNVAGIDMALGRFEEAERIFRRALFFAEENLPNERGCAFSALASLATILCSQHRINEVEQLQDEYLKKIAKQFGAKSETYICDVNGCGEMWGNEGYPERARARWNQAQSIRASLSHDKQSTLDEQKVGGAREHR